MNGWVQGDTSTVTFLFIDDGDGLIQDLSVGGITPHISFSVNGVARVENAMAMQTPQTDPLKKGKADYTFLASELKAGEVEVFGFLTDSGGGRFSMINPEVIEIRQL